MRSRRRWLLVAALAALLVLPGRAGALGLQPIGTFDQPIFVTSDPANPNRLFVVQRGGLIKVVEGGSTQTFADLTSVVRCCEGERGLLSMAVPPDFPQTGLFYVDYTGQDGPGNLHVAELRASGGTASIGTLRNVLTINHSQASNHNGGQLQFGPDGYLYVSTGDGGSTPANAQDRNSLLGKLLRIAPRQDGSQPYSVPPGNPYVGAAGADEVWAYGLRNPWRFSFDRATGDLLTADVGQGIYEELDFAPMSTGLGRGANYGWAACEGLHNYPSGTPGCILPGHTDPIFEYSHAGGGCAITGGYVARDPSLGDLYGRYLYADFCLGEIRSLVPGLPVGSGDRSEGVNVSSPVSFGEDACGRLYVAEQTANVFRLTGSGSPACTVLQVSKRGPGRGAVTGPGIDCPGDCTQVFPQPQTVVLRKHPGKHSSFSGWHRACSGHRGCSVAMTADRHVVAKFSDRLRTHVVMAAFHRVVPHGARALLRAKAWPCKGRRHDKVELFKGRKRIATKRLNRNCVARFRARIRHRSRFKVKVPADKRHFAARTGWVTVVPRG
ncbi:MAG: PQQ-dependent sugar dehydrogenase [Actinomycetota bacterium]